MFEKSLKNIISVLGIKIDEYGFVVVKDLLEQIISDVLDISISVLRLKGTKTLNIQTIKSAFDNYLIQSCDDLETQLDFVNFIMTGAENLRDHNKTLLSEKKLKEKIKTLYNVNIGKETTKYFGSVVQSIIIDILKIARESSQNYNKEGITIKDIILTYNIQDSNQLTKLKNKNNFREFVPTAEYYCKLFDNLNYVFFMPNSMISQHKSLKIRLLNPATESYLDIINYDVNIRWSSESIDILRYIAEFFYKKIAKRSLIVMKNTGKKKLMDYHVQQCEYEYNESKEEKEKSYNDTLFKKGTLDNLSKIISFDKNTEYISSFSEHAKIKIDSLVKNIMTQIVNNAINLAINENKVTVSGSMAKKSIELTKGIKLMGGNKIENLNYENYSRQLINYITTSPNRLRNK